ncbi:MAG: phosphopantetheine-binding protein [Pseudonocardiaceae bacterium]
MSVDRIRQDLAAWLPAPAVPFQLFTVAEFPMTVEGKVDRRQLRAQTWASLDTDRAPVPPGELGPRGSLAEIWQVGLRVHPAATDDFFDLGGDSLLAAEVVTRTLAVLDIDARHGSTLIHSLLRTPTLEDFTCAVEALLSGEGAVYASGTDFREEGRLVLTVPPQSGPTPRWDQPRDVLLTGAGGFVGAFLLDRLLRATTTRVHCPAGRCRTFQR